jgi:HAD superfamily hydrolase (TIGR01509 family)
VSIPQFPYYLFDIDGTLLDSAVDICSTIREVLTPHVPEPPSLDSLTRFVGFHLDVCFVEALPHFDRQQLDELIAAYRTQYLSRGHAATSIYPGALEGVRALGGLKGTATTKGTPTTRAILEQFGFLPYFDHVQGTDGFPCKPEPDVVLRSLHALGGTVDQCLFIGDSAADMEAGRRAGVKICAVTYGYGNREDMARWEPDYWVTDLRELSQSM